MRYPCVQPQPETTATTSCAGAELRLPSSGVVGTLAKAPYSAPPVPGEGGSMPPPGLCAPTYVCACICPSPSVLLSPLHRQKPAGATESGPHWPLRVWPSPRSTPTGGGCPSKPLTPAPLMPIHWPRELQASSALAKRGRRGDVPQGTTGSGARPRGLGLTGRRGPGRRGHRRRLILSAFLSGSRFGSWALGTWGGGQREGRRGPEAGRGGGPSCVA